MESRRPRLLVLSSTFPRWKDDTEPRFVESLSYELAAIFDVVVLAPHCKGAKREESFRSDGRTLTVHRFRYLPAAMETLAYDGGMLFRVRSNRLRLLLLPVFLGAQALAIVRLHCQLEFNAVHAHWIVPQGFVAAMLRMMWRRFPPFLVTSHGGDLYALRGAILEKLKRWILLRANAVTVVSHAMRDYCEERRLKPGRVVVQSMGVDLEATFTPGEQHASRNGVVFVGRLVEKKGVEYLIEAVGLLAAKHVGLELTIVGDGPLRDSLKALAKSQGVGDRVRFVGGVPNEDVVHFLRSAAISVMPSVVSASGDREGLGLVAVEAQGCGCAVIASDLPAVRDTVIDGQTGLMAKPADAVDLARKIQTLLEDDALRRRLADGGRRHAMGKFTWRTVGSRYGRIITEMLDGPRKV
ncbi:MAG: glycosyl transferase group 1 [Rickettsiales bacterium]|nr:glycosyl transferase group 1 [Rickettsiales bacterium]